MSSKVAFTAALRDMELSILAAKFEENGWGSFEDFAFSTSDPSGRDTDMFEKQVLAELLAADGSQKKLIPKIRRLYAQAYVHATALMTEEAKPCWQPSLRLRWQSGLGRCECTVPGTRLRDSC